MDSTSNDRDGALSSPPDPGSEFQFDCVVVGSGHAGSCAALAAIDAGCRTGEQLAPTHSCDKSFFSSSPAFE